MSLTVPVLLEAISVAGSALKILDKLPSQAKLNGKARGLLREIRHNLLLLDLVAKNEAPLSTVVGKLSVEKFNALDDEGFKFDRLKSKLIAKDNSLDGSDLVSWQGKSTGKLLESIYEKIDEIIVMYPIVQENSNYRWHTRVNNIRKRIWLLLKHISS